MADADWIPACAASAAVAAYRPVEYRVKRATEAWERREARALRRAVFCAEQRLFDFTDADAVDDDADTITLVAVSCVHGMSEDVVGTVRVHALGGDVWQGSRLAVRREYRGQAWLGSELIHLAVSLAHAEGARQFVAQVQQQHAALFERLHWRALGAVELRGRPHLRMEADLACYPPCAAVERSLLATMRSAA